MIDLAFQLSKHAAARLRQRGYREAALDLVPELKRTIQRLERLRGTAVIVAEEVVASVYRPDRAKMRRLLRTGRRRTNRRAV